MQAPRLAESSVLFSLKELRQLELSRIDEERAAVRDAELSQQRVREAAAREAEAAAEARRRAEHEAELAAAHAQAESERQLRLHVEATEAAERARHQAALDQERLAGELALRRAEVAKKRPTWMLAVTACAVLAGAALVWFAIETQEASQAAERERAAAIADKEKAQAYAREATAQMARFQAELAELDRRVAKGVHDIGIAADDAARERVRQDMLAAERDRAAVRARLDAAQRVKDHLERTKPIELGADCVNNSLSKECLKKK
jgi:hypothetical protein